MTQKKYEVRMSSVRSFFSFKISFPWLYFFLTILAIGMIMIVVLNNSDYNETIKFLKMLFVSVTFTSQPLHTDDTCQRDKNQNKLKDHQK